MGYNQKITKEIEQKFIPMKEKGNRGLDSQMSL